MRKDKIIIKTLGILQEELSQNGNIEVSIVHLFFFDTYSNISDAMNGEFAGIKSENFDEGFYYNILDKKYYYYGEAISENEGSFGNKFAFLIEEELLSILPGALKQALKRVGTTRESELLYEI